MGYLLKFGGFTLPDTLRPSAVGGSQHRAASLRPRASGSITQIARREEGTLDIHGEFSAGSAADLETALDLLAAAIYNGKQVLYYGRDDQYYRDAQVQAFHVDWHDGLLHDVCADIQLQFVASDYPERFAVAAQTPALGPTGGNIAVVGTAIALPTWTITIGGAGTGALTLANSTTGESALLTPLSGSWNAGDVIVLNRDTYQVTLNGALTFGLLDLRIPALDPSLATNNAIVLASAGTATVASLVPTYYARFK